MTCTLVVHDPQTSFTRSICCVDIYSLAKEMKPCAISARARNISKAVADRQQAFSDKGGWHTNGAEETDHMFLGVYMRNI